MLTREGYAIDQWYQNLGEKEGVPLSEVIGVYSQIHPEDRKVMFNFFEQVKKGQCDSIRRELRVKYGEGWHWTRVNVMRNTQSTNPDRLEMICVNYDITELKETQKQREKAEELDRLKSAFLANMSHEIRTPLNAIVGFSNLMNSEEVLEPEEREQFVKLINTNSDLLLKLINDILDLSRMESGKMSFVFDRHDLNVLINEIYCTFQLMMPEGVELRMRVPEIPVVVAVDPYRLKQVLSNFINNAIKFTTSGYIEVGYYFCTKGDCLHIYVEDTGIGIPEEKQKQVFDRFCKLDEFAQGTGLGLAICQVIAQRFGGEIQLKSEYGKGSRFTLTLPKERIG